jgi:hypothetical protein
MDEEKVLVLNSLDWEYILKELTLYTAFKINGLKSNHRNKFNIHPYDLAMEAINKVLIGERAWDMERYPDIVIHLKGIAKSLLSSYRKSVDARETIPSQLSFNTSSGEVVVDLLDDIHDCHEVHTEIIAAEYARMLEESLSDDFEAQLVLVEMLEFKKPGEIAACLELPANKVNNAIRRIRRKAATLFNS